MKYCEKKENILRATIGLILVLLSFTAQSQITVHPVQNFNFGTFIGGQTGGTIEVSADGTRTGTGDIYLINSGTAPSQAIFEIEAPEGTIISFLTEDAILTGSNGGSMTLKIGETAPLSPFNISVAPPGRTQLHLGGTLTVGDRSQSPPGEYQGTLTINFNYQ